MQASHSTTLIAAGKNDRGQVVRVQKTSLTGAGEGMRVKKDHGGFSLPYNDSRNTLVAVRQWLHLKRLSQGCTKAGNREPTACTSVQGP